MRKLLCTLVASLFCLSLSSSNQIVTGIYDHCFAEANFTEGMALYLGFSASDAYEMGNNTFDRCIDVANLEFALNNR